MRATLSIWRHQWLRLVRLGSTADTVIRVISRGSVLIGLLLGWTILVVLPEETGRVILREGLSAFLSDYLFVLAAVALILSAWLSGGAAIDLFAYRFYPISLGKLAACVLIRRAFHVRYVTIGAAVTITLLLVRPGAALSPLLVAGTCIVLLDVAAVWFQALHDKYLWISYLIILTLLSVTCTDMLGGHELSGYAFEIWMRSSDEMSFALLILLSSTCAALMTSFRRMRSLLRYGS